MASLEDVIFQRFEALNTVIEHLEELKQEQVSLSEFLQSWRIQSMVLHNLQIVYHLWQERISDFRKYAQYIASFVAEQI